MGDNVNQFFDALGISADEVPETSAVDDSESENAVNREVKLYKISDASGSLDISEVSGMPLTQDMLNAEVRFENALYSVYIAELYRGVSQGSGHKTPKSCQT